MDDTNFNDRGPQLPSWMFPQNEPPQEPEDEQEPEDTDDTVMEPQPEDEAIPEPQAEDEPAAEPVRPVYTPPVDTTYRWANPDLAAKPAPAPKKKNRKRRNLVAVACMCLCCALVGAVGGGLVAGSMASRQRQEDLSALRQEFAQMIPAETAAPETQPAATYPVSNSVPTEGLMTPSQVYQMNVASVVTVTTTGVTSNGWTQSQFVSSGSGFFISEDGYVLTNHHVIEDGTEVVVTANDGKEYPARVVGSDSLNDVALLKVEAENLPAVSIGNSDTLQVGDMVAAIGNPLGTLAYTQTVGYVSAKDRTVSGDGTIINMIQTDAAINSGNSGGPLFDMAGNVVGITSAKYSGSTSSGASIEGIGFAIPINDAMALVKDLMEYGYITGQAYLGVTLRNLDESLAAAYGLPVGPRVESVVDGSCAQKAGVQPGDIIIALGDKEVANYTELTYALRSFRAGDKTVLHIFRSGQNLDLPITLDEKPQVIEQPTEPEPSQQPSGQMPSAGSYEDWFNYFAPFFGMNP